MIAPSEPVTATPGTAAAEVLFTSQGYLILSAETARTYFPADTLLAMRRNSPSTSKRSNVF